MGIFDLVKKKVEDKSFNSEEPVKNPFTNVEGEDVAETAGNEKIVNEEKVLDAPPAPPAPDFIEESPFQQSSAELELETVKNSINIIIEELKEVMSKVENIERGIKK
ncbi:hypothetical protein COX58_01165 [archaeon CG_4_10_14_0_2_um_filter_Archaea_38_6]|nr:MAG: hypothetical protein COS83_01955 [archaeon CG07_land_8_20_14_0_80_38_8]PIU88602.1 MAG: hypothetical protein COS64_03125 [archaeon CG06_land_8_20_14_3_00_37_11]PJA22800.1 MAG: hypothetical protein COX58_01165 [archaeon CG_4_10_14_0_2_um_filter_Archaea_38_6]